MNPDEVQIERLLSALERIAMALEVSSGLSRPEEAGIPDTSDVLYVNDEAEAAKEWRRDSYTWRTGIELPEGEEPPSHGPKGQAWPEPD